MARSPAAGAVACASVGNGSDAWRRKYEPCLPVWLAAIADASGGSDNWRSIGSNGSSYEHT